MISKKLFKRIASIGLSAVLAFSAPVTSFAAEGVEDFGVLTADNEDESSFDEKEISAPDETDYELEYESEEEAAVPDETKDEEEGEDAGSDDEYEDDAEAESEEEADPESADDVEDPEVVDENDAEEAKLLEVEEGEISTWEELCEKMQVAGNYTLIDDVTCGEDDEQKSVNVSANVILDLKGHVITGDSDNSVFTLAGNTVFRLKDSAPETTHSNAYTYTHPDYDEDQVVTGGIITGGTHGIHTKESANIIIDGGTIYGNDDKAAGDENLDGGGVCLDGSSSLYMSKGGIIKNTSGYCGGGVGISDNAVFTMRGGEIIDNTAVIGGGVNMTVTADGGMYMYSGCVIGNRATSYGGGINWKDTPTHTDLYVSGNVRVTDNVCDGTASNILFGESDSSKINVSDNLDSESRLGVSLKTIPASGSRIITSTRSGCEVPDGVFFSDDTGYSVEREENRIVFSLVPAISGRSVWRTDASTAKVKFFSDSVGTYYYVVSDEADAPTAEYIEENKDGYGAIEDAGTVVIGALENLSSGEKYVHVVVGNTYGNMSNVLTIAMPCDNYYFDDFESYPEGIYINQEGSPLFPIEENNSGSASRSQKVTGDEDVDGNVLSLTGITGGSSDQFVNLSAMTVPENSVYVLEGRFKTISSTDRDGIRFTLMNGISYGLNAEAGLYVIGNTGRRHNSSGNTHNFGPVTGDQWHTVKITANPGLRTYEVRVDDRLLAEDVPAPALINNIGISSFWDATSVFDDVEFYTLPYELPVPEITGESVWRTSAAQATVKFFTNTSGTYYYKVTDSSVAPDVDTVMLEYDGTAEGTRGTVSVNLDGLTAGAKYVHVVYENTVGISDVHTIALPYDVYYHEDFESYMLGTNVASSALTPIYQVHPGSGNLDQAVLRVDESSDNALQLKCQTGNGSDHLINLTSMSLAEDDFTILEGKIFVDGTGTDNTGVFRLALLNGGSYLAKNEAGIHIEDYHVYQHYENKSAYDFGTVEAGKWYKIKIVAHPSEKKYSLYIDDVLIDANVTVDNITKLDYIGITSFRKGLAYFDDLEFYQLPAVTVEFDSDGGTSVASVDTAKGYPVVRPGDPEKEGYEFKGWMLNGADYDFSAPVVQPITLKAKWEYVGPRLKGMSVWRKSATAATVRFSSNTAGKYFYQVTDSEIAPDAATIKENPEGTGDTIWGTVTIDSVEGLDSGAKYLHIVVDDNTSICDAYTIPMPYDVYYFEDFESYAEDTYINQSGRPMWPIREVNRGNGSANQKVMDIDDDHDKVLRLVSSGFASDQCIELGEASIPSGSYYVLEGKFNLLSSGHDDGLRFDLMANTGYGSGAEGGLFIYDGWFTTKFREKNLREAEFGKWYTAKLVADPASRLCDIYVDNELLAQGVQVPSTIKFVGISTVWVAETYLDDLTFYILPPFTVSFDSAGGSEVASQKVMQGKTATRPADPTRDGCTFNGWLLDDEPYDFNCPVNDDIELVADWIIDINPSILVNGWTYGDTSDHTPSLEEGSNPGGADVTYEYKVKDASDDTYTEDMPVSAGEYTVRASVAAIGKYSAGTATADFTITKATLDNIYAEDTVPNRIATRDKKLQLPTLPDGATYVNEGIQIGGADPGLVVEGSAVVNDTLLVYSTTAQDPGAKATVTITVSGGNNYENCNLTVTVSTDGMLAVFKDGVDEFIYTGAKITPEIEVYNNGELLTAGVDYTVSYSGNINVTRNKTTGLVTAGGKVTIKGKGNLSDSKVLTFTILPKDLNGEEIDTPEIEIGDISIAAGQKATAPVITYGSYKLAAKDYTITDPMSGKVYPEAGEFALEVEGKGNFTGKAYVPVHVKKTKEEVRKLGVIVDTKTAVFFDPFATEDQMKAKLASLITVYDAADKTKAPIGMDGNYVITYPSDVLNAGKKTITIVGIGPYTGSVSKAITIKPLVVKQASSNGSVYGNPDVISQNEYHFIAGGVTLGDDLVVTYENPDGAEKQLTEGTDYKVTYTNNKAVSKEGKPAEYSITFLGNYKGTPAIKNTKAAKVNVFTILTAAIADEDGKEADGFESYTPDVAYTGKPGTYYSAPVVTLNGSTLAASNYTVKYYLKNGEEDYSEITSKNKLTLPDGVDEVVVEVRITAKGSVAGKGNYSGTIKDSYSVIRQKADTVYDLSKARITIYGAGYNPANKTNKKLSGIPFNGYPRKVTDIDPETGAAYGKIVVDYKIGKIYVPLTEGVDYEVKYLNNINKGKSVVIINGTNQPNDDQIAFAGSKRTTFSITTSSLKKYLKELLGL